MGGLVAQEESELVGIDAGFGESLILNADGALHEPPGLGHLPNQERFGLAGGSVLVGEMGQQGFEFGGIFARYDGAAGSEPVFERVGAGDGFAFGCCWAGGTSSRRGSESGFGDRLGGRTAGPTSVFKGSGCSAALLVLELSGFALGFAALFAEFARRHQIHWKRGRVGAAVRSECKVVEMNEIIGRGICDCLIVGPWDSRSHLHLYSAPQPP